MYLIECGLNEDQRNTVLAMVHDYTIEFIEWTREVKEAKGEDN